MKILIIDMDRKMAQYESDCLKTFRYDCDISESGQEGLKMAVDNDYCCIILETDLESQKVIGEKAHNYIVEHNTWDVLARKFIKTYEKVM